MDHVLDSEVLSPADIRHINYCRLYLQAVTVSDISMASGLRLFSGIHKRNQYRDKEHHDVATYGPSETGRSGWKIWKIALELFSTNGIIHKPLYDWIDPPSEQRRTWTAYFDPQTNYLLTKRDDKFEVHFRCNQTYGFEPGATQISL